MLVSSQFLVDQSGNILISKKIDHSQQASDTQKVKRETNGWTPDRTMRLQFSVPPLEYHKWVDELGLDCWSDPEFLKFYKAHRPEFSL